MMATASSVCEPTLDVHLVVQHFLFFFCLLSRRPHLPLQGRLGIPTDSTQTADVIPLDVRTKYACTLIMFCPPRTTPRRPALTNNRFLLCRSRHPICCIMQCIMMYMFSGEYGQAKLQVHEKSKAQDYDLGLQRIPKGGRRAVVQLVRRTGSMMRTVYKFVPLSPTIP
jgi:hypothetical protein